MNIYALLSYWDERPEHLTRCVRSLEGFCDHLVAVDGCYATFDPTRAYSAAEQFTAIQSAATFPTSLIDRAAPWASEVHKRARMFDYGRAAGATPDDWFLIIDADMALAEFTPDVRELLAATERDVAEVRWQDIQIDGKPVSTNRFRSMFRALPGLTVERAHYLYVVDCEPCEGGGNFSVLRDCTTFDRDCACNGPRLVIDPCKDCNGTGCRFLWHQPNGHLSDEPILDLFGHVTLHHFNSSRDGERKRRALAYYEDRDARGLEAVGRDWTGLGVLS